MCSDDCCDCCDNDCCFGCCTYRECCGGCSNCCENCANFCEIMGVCFECLAIMGERGGVTRSEKATQINDEQPITIFVISKNRQ